MHNFSWHRVYLIHLYKALAAKGAEVVKADLRDRSSLEEAFKGAYGVFGVTSCSFLSIMLDSAN